MRHIAVFMFVVVALAASFSLAAQAEEAQVTIALPADLDALDPHLTTNSMSWMMLANMFDTLVQLGPDGTYEPMLATSWSRVDDVTWRFQLREGVRFHNGEPFTARSVRYSFERLKDPELMSPAVATYRGSIEEIRVVDDYTVDVVTEQPYAPLLSLLGILWIVPQDYIEEVGMREFARHPVGTGPYRFVEWRRGHQLVLEANPDYWAGEPEVKRVVFRPIPDASTRMAALLAGEVDIITVVPLDRLPELERNPNVYITSRPGELIYLGVNTFKEGLSDLRVRQALSHAIDVDAIIEALLMGRAVRANGPFFRTTPGYRADLPPYEYNPDKARQLLREAGVTNLRIELDVSPLQGVQKPQEVGEAIAGFLQDVGVQVQVNVLEPGAAIDKYGAREMDMYLFPWGSFPESGRHLQVLLHSEARGYYYKSEEADRLIDAYMAAVDPEERERIGRELHTFLYEDLPFIYMYEQEELYGVRSRIQWDPGVDFVIRAANIKLVQP